MYQHQSPTNTPLRRLGVVTAIGAVLCAGGLLALGGTANASEYHGDGDPPLPIDEIEDLFAEDDDPILDAPVLTIPEDGPVFEGPIVTIPVVPDDDGPIYDGPIFDGPILTIPIVPGDATPEDAPPEDTAPPAEQAPVDQQPTTPPAEEGPTGPANVAPFVNITSATVDCGGMVNVTYETGATPAPATENEHVVMFSPASNPAAVTSHRLQQRPVNGTFNVAMQSPAAEAYRVFVVADFEPVNLDGVVLVDELDVPAPADCPAPAIGG